jgi:Flp pilus assembly pilin Flp
MIPVYRARAAAQPFGMFEDQDETKRKKQRWGSVGYIALIVGAILIAVFVLRPLGQGLTNPFSAITSALGGQQK